MDSAGEKIIVGRDICFSYGSEKIFSNINFDIFHGEFLGIIGPNGGGKTSFVKILLGLLKYSSGKLYYPNPHLFSFPKDLGYVPQNTQINLHFPIMAVEVVEMGLLEKRLFGFRIKKKQRQLALEILEKLGLLESAYKKISDLSGGQIQRVLIGRALSGNPKLLILDEPTSNIDAKAQSEIFNLLRDINKYHTIIIISHDIPLTLEYASRIFHINRAVHAHSTPPITLRKDGHICEIDIFQDFVSSAYDGSRRA